MTYRFITTLGVLFFAAMAVAGGAASAQPGPSLIVSHEFFPYANLANPSTALVNGQRNFEQDLQIRLGVFHAELSSPSIYAQGATVIVHTLSYDWLQMAYRNWDDTQGGNKIDDAHGVEYTLTVVRQLSDAWSLTAVATPGLHSDFEGSLSVDDFSVSSAVIFSRQHSSTLCYGIGAAYSFNFGQAYPIPLIALNWTVGARTRLDLLLPAHAELWYTPSSTVDVGLTARVSGNQYHGDPDLYGVENPQMQYSSGTVGPSARLHLAKKLQINVDAGVTMLRRFDFSDGSDEMQSLDLENSGFVRVGLTIGG